MPSFLAAQKFGTQPTVTPEYLTTARAKDSSGKQRINDSLIAEEISKRDKDFSAMWEKRKGGGEEAARGLLNYYTYGDENYGQEQPQAQYQFTQNDAMGYFNNPEEISAQLRVQSPETRIPGAFSYEDHQKALKENPVGETIPQVGKQLFNAGAGAVNLAKSAYNITGLPGATSNPLEAAKGLGQLALGGLEMFDDATFGKMGLGTSDKPTGIPYLDNAEPVARQAFQELVVNRYGSLDALQKTMYEDPLGFIADVMTIGESLRIAKGASTASKGVKGATAAAVQGATPKSGIGFVGKAMKAPVIGAKKISDAAGEIAKGLHGAKMGVGKAPIDETIRTARFGTPEGNIAMREGAAAASVNEAKVLDDVLRNLNQGREIMGDRYRSKLSSLKSPELDTNPIGDVLKKQMERFNLEMSQKKIGKGDLSKESTFGYNRSSISPDSDAAMQIEKYINEAMAWGKDPRQTFDVIGLDTLKKRLSDVFPEDPKARAFVTPIQNELVKTLNKVPGYKEMTSEYEHLSGILDDVKTSLSTGASKDTAIRKLTNIMKDTHEFKAEALRALLEMTGDTTTLPKLAGLSMGKWNARGAAGVLSPVTSLSAYTLGGIAGAFADVTISSPKIMREFYSALGFTQRQVDKLIEFGRKKGLGKAFNDDVLGAAAQTGRVNDAVKKRKQVEDLFPVPASQNR